jgi:hypothetical protein
MGVVQDEQLTASYRLETATKLKQVKELSDPDHPRLFHATQCSQCSGHLDLPSIHFMCNHSFHQRSVYSPFFFFFVVATHGAICFAGAWAITIRNARCACAHTALYRKSAEITSALQTNMTFSWQT